MNQDVEQPIDTGAQSLTLTLGVLGIAASAEQIRHTFALRSGQTTTAEQLIRHARSLNLKARMVSVTFDRLAKTPLPAVARLTDGQFVVLGKADESRVLIQSPIVGRPEVISGEDFRQRWDGTLILIARRAGLTGSDRRFGLSWFVPAMVRYRRVLGEVLVASLFVQILGLVSPLLFQVVIDKVLVHRGLTTLDVILLGLVLVGVFEALLGALRSYVFAHTTTRIDVELGARLFRHLTSLPLAYFGARRAGDSVARVRELETIRSFLTGSALTLVLDLFFTLAFLAVMALYSPLLTMITLGSIPAYALISILVTPILKTRLDERFKRGAENQAFLVECVSGIETVKAMALEPQMQQRWDEQLAGYVRSAFDAQKLSVNASQAIQLINKLTTAAILYFGAKLVIENSLTVGELVAFNMLASHVAQPVLRIAQLWQDFQQTRIAVDRLGDILNTPGETRNAASRTVLPAIQGRVAFDHVGFRYRPEAGLVLDDISFAIPAGQVVGIVGPSGSGKSTLAKLIQRLYVPERGRVLVDGVDLAMVDTAWLRRQIGIVLQENVLFNRTVRENIALADPGVPIERVIHAAQLAGAHDFILDLPFGYDTEIGERGASLSGGQRQRVAIARALVSDPRILIFDEATSALDYESERVIQENMRRIVAGRTVIIIAHRLSTVRNADRILTIERGRLVEDGDHDSLVRSGGRYAMLHRIQAGLSDAV